MNSIGAWVSDADTSAVLAQLADGLTALAHLPLTRLSDNDLLALNRAVTAFTAGVQAARLAQLAEIEDRGAALTVGASTTVAWIKTATRVRHGHAVRDLRLAQALADRYRDTAAALAEGAVNLDHAEEIRACLDALPDHIDPDTRVDAERTLLEHAHTYDPKVVHRLGQHLHTVLDPDGPEDIAAAETDAHNSRALFVQTYDDGTVHLRGTLDPETGALLIATLQPLAAPRPVDDQGTDTTDTDTETTAGGPDLRTAAQRRVDALREILHLATTHPKAPTTGAARPTIFVTISYPDLADQVGAGLLHGSHSLTPATVRRLACDADLIPTLLGTQDELLGIGRRSRTVPSHLRAALIQRDGHCRHPGCRQPPTTCHAHHIQHWADNGPTDLDNLVLLCHHHHRLTHRDNWQITPHPGQPPTITPPQWAQAP